MYIDIYTHTYFQIFIEVYLVYNVVLISGIQQSESVIHIHIFILFQIFSPYRESLILYMMPIVLWYLTVYTVR